MAAGEIAGNADTDSTADMIKDLNDNFPKLTKHEKFNLVNLPEEEAHAGQSKQSATLCDICLAVPSVKETLPWEEVVELCDLVFQYKRVISTE